MLAMYGEAMDTLNATGGFDAAGLGASGESGLGLMGGLPQPRLLAASADEKPLQIGWGDTCAVTLASFASLLGWTCRLRPCFLRTASVARCRALI